MIDVQDRHIVIPDRGGFLLEGTSMATLAQTFWSPLHVDRYSHATRSVIDFIQGIRISRLIITGLS